MKISTTGIYNKHKRNCKSDALQLSMKELTEIYKDLPIDAQMFKRYKTLKRQLYRKYTILPQIFIGMVTGIATGVLATGIYQQSLSIWTITALILFAIVYLWGLSRFLFSAHIQVLTEHEILLIEKKIKN